MYHYDPQYAHMPGNVEQTLVFAPISVLWNSKFAISLFFVISGYALSYKYFMTKSQEYLRASLIKRYFRLEIPILFSVLVSYILLIGGSYSNAYIANNFTKSTFWFDHLWNMNASFPSALNEAFVSSLFTGGSPLYNPVLWTMVIEFMGSILVFSSLALFGNSGKRFLVYAILTVVLHIHYFPAFIVGLAMCDYYHAEKKKRLPGIPVLFIFLTGLYIGGYQRIPVTNIWRPFDFISDMDSTFPFIIGAALFVLAVINSAGLIKFFSSRALLFLGKMSFSIYLIHLLIIGSLGCYLFKCFFAGLHLSYGISFSLMFLISLSFTFGASLLMYKYVDKNGIKFSKWIYSKFFTVKAKEEGK